FFHSRVYPRLSAKARQTSDLMRMGKTPSTADIRELERQSNAIADQLQPRRFSEQPRRSTGGAVDPARCQYLLRLSAKGKALKAKEAGKPREASIYAEAMGPVFARLLQDLGPRR